MRSTYQRKVDKKQIPTCNIMGVNIAAINMEWLLEYLDKNLDDIKGDYICVSNVHTTVTSYEHTDLMEMHILELSKLPSEEKNETSLLQWMRFLGGKTRKDFEEMAKKNSELEEAYDVLDKLSADEKKRLEYETRQRAIRDYNIGMLTAERRGIEAGRKIGREEGRAEGETLGVSRIN